MDETDIGQVKVGQNATFTVDTFPNRTFTASVSKIGQLSTSTSTISPSSSSSTSSSTTASSSSSSVVYYYVTLNVDDPEDLLKVDMTARVNIKTGEKTDALLIPLSALKTSSSGQYVNVLRSNGATENVSVTTGLTSNENVEIVSGLQEGDQLVVSYAKSQTTTSSSTKKDSGPPPM